VCSPWVTSKRRDPNSVLTIVTAGEDGGQSPVPVGPASGSPSGGRPNRSLLIGRLDGVAIRVHWTFLFVVVVIVAADQPRGWWAVTAGLAWVIALFASVVMHELAHCIVARRRGAVVFGILLLPIGGLSQLDRIPDKPADELAIASVGPLTSLGLGLILLLGGITVGLHVWPPSLWTGPWLARLGWMNLLLGAFNLAPALPMDGGRVLRSLLERRFDRAEATRLAVKVARIIAYAMIVVGFAYDLWLFLIGLFVLVGASAEKRDATSEETHRRSSGHP
jgi:Zn-dependent protease